MALALFLLLGVNPVMMIVATVVFFAVEFHEATLRKNVPHR